MNSVERILYTTDNTPSEALNMLNLTSTSSNIQSQNTVVIKEKTAISQSFGSGEQPFLVVKKAGVLRQDMMNNTACIDEGLIYCDNIIQDTRSSIIEKIEEEVQVEFVSKQQGSVQGSGVVMREMLTDEELLASGWPWNGGITFVNASMRYREDFDPVLKGVSVSISPGESVGIVGRTGSGKSTLFRVLLRLSELEAGQILIDGVDIARIGLDTLRSRISIIPQDAVLFSGSIRMNLDPFLQHGDEELWTALRKAHALGMIAGLPGGLSFQVSEGGENFSAGQRQQLCLAR